MHETADREGMAGRSEGRAGRRTSRARYRLAILACVLLLSLAGCAASPESSSEHSVAYKLYVIDTQSPPASEEAEELRPYQCELLLLAEKCTNPEGQLADYAVSVKQTLSERFADATTLEILQLANAGLDGQAAGDCRQGFALAGAALERAR